MISSIDMPDVFQASLLVLCVHLVVNIYTLFSGAKIPPYFISKQGYLRLRLTIERPLVFEHLWFAWHPIRMCADG